MNKDLEEFNYYILYNMIKISSNKIIMIIVAQVLRWLAYTTQITQ